MAEPTDADKVVEILVNELDKHGHGDFHYDGPDYRDPNVVAALVVGRAWLEVRAVTARGKELEELCSYYDVPDSKESDPLESGPADEPLPHDHCACGCGSHVGCFFDY